MGESVSWVGIDGARERRGTKKSKKMLQASRHTLTPLGYSGLAMMNDDAAASLGWAGQAGVRARGYDAREREAGQDRDVGDHEARSGTGMMVIWANSHGQSTIRGLLSPSAISGTEASNREDSEAVGVRSRALFRFSWIQVV